MSTRLFQLALGAATLLFSSFAIADFPEYTGSSPFSFSVPEIPAGFGDFLTVWDLDQDGLLDFLYRSNTKLYAYAHDGDSLWSRSIPLSAGVNGSGMAVLDVDGDGDLEVVAPDTSDNLRIYAADDGTLLRTEAISVGSNQRIGYIAVANLQGKGDREVIVQTVDERWEHDGKGWDGYSYVNRYYFYINRNIIALDLSTSPETVLWTVQQDRVVNDGKIYDGYWGQAHGSFMCADIDNDGLDEVVGGNYIDNDGTKFDLSYPDSWVGSNNYDFIDHLDAIAIGDFRPDSPGLEWVITEEDHNDKTDWHTALMTKSGYLWRKETTLFTGDDQEPQDVAVGNFDDGQSGIEVWNRSRFGGLESHTEGTGQHPWMYSYQGTELSSNHYNMEDVLPNGFFNDDSKKGYGLEMIWTIDWAGSSTNHIAGQNRYEDGHLGVFDATDGSSIFNTISYGDIDAKNMYIADIAGDSREEIVSFDVSNSSDIKIKVFWNEDSNTDNNPNKWDDPLYKRIKQNWSYYSPGSYTQRDPVLLTVQIFLEGPYTASSKMDTSLLNNDYIPNASPYTEDLKTVSSFPDGIVDWVLLELRDSDSAGDTAITYQSAFLRYDGYIVNEEGNTALNLFVNAGSYYIVVHHRNHLAVMSSSTVALNTSSTTSYDFTSGSGQFYGSNGAVEVGDSNWGMIMGNAYNENTVINIVDYFTIKEDFAEIGYLNTDVNLSGVINLLDYFITKSNFSKSATVP